MDKHKKLRQTLKALPESRRLLVYLIFGVLGTIIITLASFLNRQSGNQLPSVLAKALVALAALWLAGAEAFIPLRNKKSLIWLILAGAAVPAVFLVFRLGRITESPSPTAVLTMLCSIFLTALWEEAVFRLWGRLLFEEEESYKARDFLWMAVVFGCMHLLNLLFGEDPHMVLIQAAFATVTAVFMQTVYCKSGSLGLIIGVHFFINAASQLVPLFIKEENRFLRHLAGLDIIIGGFFFAISAALIARKGNIIRRGRPFLKFRRKE